MTPEEILRKPYHRVLVPDGEGMWFGEIVEFPGCFAVGRTAASCAADLEGCAIAWLKASLHVGQSIGEPIEDVIRQARKTAGIGPRPKKRVS